MPSAGSAALAARRYLSLTTCRRSGVPVATPVWVALDGDELVVVTPADSGKVTRLRANRAVGLQPCGRSGALDPATTPVTGVARVVDDAGEARRATALIRVKYGLEYRLVLAVERLGRAGRRRRVVLRISVPAG